MTYEEVIAYLYKQLPMFHRIGAAAYKANLDNTYAICEVLNQPQHKFKAIHIAGTNGKGSTSHMLAAILMAAGYKVGLYTSPHLKDFRERIKINGQEIPQDSVIAFVEQHKSAFEKIQPSFFEWTVGLCFDYFSKVQVDIAVIETGLGGRLDSTNVINPLLSIITNIGLDHMDLLGPTLEAIAKEKAGIIKAHTPVIIGETHPETRDVFLNKADDCQAPIFFADQLFKVQRMEQSSDKLELDIAERGDLKYESLQLDLKGIYQEKNILSVIKATTLLTKLGFAISKEQLYAGLRDAAKTTKLRGRWDVIKHEPLVVCDTAHNAHGMKEVLKQIARTAHKKLHMVFGMVGDKDISGVLELLPQSAQYYFCHADMPRAMPAKELASKAADFGLLGSHYPSVQGAKLAAIEAASEGDLVYIGGSTFVVAEAI